MTGQEKLEPQSQIIINGHNGFFLTYLRVIMTLKKIKHYLLVIWQIVLKKMAQEIWALLQTPKL